MKLKIKVIANAKKSNVIQEKNFLKIKVDAPAQKGKANKRLIEILAEHFKVSKTKIKIIKGHKSREKVIELINP